MEGIDLTEFMRQIQIQMKANADNINDNIKQSNIKLEREIKESRQELKQEITSLNMKINEVSKDTEKIKETVVVNKGESEKRFNRMEERIEEIVKEGNKQSQQKRKREEIIAKNVDKTVTSQPEEKSYASRLKNNKEDDKIEKLEFKSTWARQMSQLSLEKQLEEVSKAAEKMERDGEYPERGRSKVKKVLMGNSQELHDSNDWPWDMNESEWDGTADRVERNNARKEKSARKKKEKLEKAANVAKCTVGLGPVKTQSISYFNKITGDFGEAKKMAAAEFMTEYLKFNHDDMSDMDITDTKISPKGDEILYVVFDSPGKAKNVRRRIADCRNPAIKTRDFVPPQFFKRYSAMSKIAAGWRSGDKGLKTQIRFEKDDISLYTKRKGTEEPYSKIETAELELEDKLPELEPHAEWKRKEEKPAWRQASPEIREVKLKSLGEAN